MNYPCYPDYKPSGTEWLGEVPAHWGLKRLKYIASHNDDVLSETTDPDYVMKYVDISSVTLAKGIEKTEEYTFEKAPSRARRKVRDGDTIVSTVRTYLKAIAPIEAPEDNLVVSTGFAVIRPRAGIMPHYLAYQLQTQGFVDAVVANSVGVSYPAINASQLVTLPALIPSVNEQCAIATFLDRETTRIDSLIAKKQQLIELLVEKRTVLIGQAVTKGLDPDAPMKDSGVEWLGEIPEHWESGNLRRFALMRTGHTPNRNEPSYWENCEIPWFTLADVWQLRDGKQIYLGETKERISELGLANSAAELLPNGTVVFSRTASVGFSGIMPIPMATTQDFWNWIPGAKLLSEYLLYLFRAMRQEFSKLTMGSTHKTIYQPDAARLCICVPPTTEQQAIIDHVRSGTAKIDALVGKVEAAVEMLKEYRAALIADAVTGKVDVRSFVNEREVV